MRGPDLDKERSEKKLTLPEFLSAYNEKLPTEFPRVSKRILEVFSEKYPGSFKQKGMWSLDQHRKRVMDWLPEFLRSNPDAK